MSKRQLHQQQQPVLTDIQLNELVEHDENPNLFEHLIEDFQDMMSDKQVLRNCVEKFIDNVIDEFTLGIIFDVHRKFKTNAYCLDVDASGEEEDCNKTEVFQQNSVKNYQKCVCPNPNCKQAVAPLRFDRHLAKCMGVSDRSRSSRNASRRAASNKDKGDTSAYAGVPSDDDDDEDWNSRRNKKKDKNGGKKNRGTPKKNLEHEPIEPINVDIEGGYEDVTNLRFMVDQGRRSYVMDLQERRSNSSSPTEASGTSTTPKKRDKAKKKAKGKDRGSPSTSLSFD